MADKIELDLVWLQRLAEYYQFPMAMFFGNVEMLKDKPKTREEAIRLKLDAYNKIEEIIDELRESVNQEHKRRK